jgi:acylaminoacyl-peptidase
VVGNDGERPELDPIESEIYAIDVASGERRALTDRDGPDGSPAASPDGRYLAWLGYDDKLLSYQQRELYVRRLPDGEPRVLSGAYDHALSDISWNAESSAVHALASVEGELQLVEINLDGVVRTLAAGIGGTTLGRPYASGDYAVHGSGEQRLIAWTAADPMRPAELALQRGNGSPMVVTDLNSDLLDARALPRIEELQVKSRLDGLTVEAWMAVPEGVEADGTAPMILEIHGGPYAMYTPSFAAEIQRYAAEGYVTVWANPRGSTGYGEDFALEIDQAYPGPDHEDLMSVVDAVVERGWVDPDRLFITGGSGGGVLSAYATGMTDRFAAAAVIKPVINWFTMALAGDIGVNVSRDWIRATPWEDPQKYFDLSQIRVVGNVTTPTLVMVGEEDWRTPAWEAEQWYSALKMRGVPSAYVRVPGASHTIAKRPSHLVAKTDTIMAWFARYDVTARGDADRE